MSTEKTDRADLFCKTFIAILVIVLAFILFWSRREGGAYLVGLISNSPFSIGAGAAALGVAKKYAPALFTSSGENASTVAPDASESNSQIAVATQTEGSGQT